MFKKHVFLSVLSTSMVLFGSDGGGVKHVQIIFSLISGYCDVEVAAKHDHEL
jgi:hypothetical protein